MIAQAWGHNPHEKVLGAPQLYLFEPHQTEQMNWKPDVFLDITEVWDKKLAAIQCMVGQEHLWTYYTNLAQNRANHFKRNSGGQSGGRNAKYAEGFQSMFPRTVDELAMNVVVQNIARVAEPTSSPASPNAASRPCTRRRGASACSPPICGRSIRARASPPRPSRSRSRRRQLDDPCRGRAD